MVCVVIVDTVRPAVHASRLGLPGEIMGVAAAALGCAFPGAWVGTRALEQVTLRALRLAVAGMLVVVGVGLLTGLV